MLSDFDTLTLIDTAKRYGKSLNREGRKGREGKRHNRLGGHLLKITYVRDNSST